MNSTRRMLVAGCVAWTLVTVSYAATAETSRPVSATSQRQPIDLVIALDVSGSMSGLIDSAKQRLWDIVNELSRADQQPDLRMAILTYGNPSYGQQSGFVRIDMPFTRDLDAINKTLFSFGTDGGDEYVARVIHRSVTDLDWSNNPDALKILFVAGNEEADQDPQITRSVATEMATNAGIVVNTLYCGDENDGIVAGWRAYSSRTNGLFASIDQDAAAVAAISTPMDEQLVTLNEDLNSTYVAYGKDGDERKANQVAQDKNAAAMSAPAVASRTVAKVGRLYDNAKWDLVDAIKAGATLADIEAEALPEVMLEMDSAEQAIYVQELVSKREEVSAKIATLDRQRRDYIGKERARLSSQKSGGLDEAIIDGIRKLAEEKGFSFEE